ncbi:MAG: cytochrome ubiquinol oxidase subunit I [Thermofilum sp.]
MDTVFLGFAGLGLALLIHIAFVSITLGTGLAAAWTRWLAYKRGDRELELASRRFLKLLLVTELYSGVWGTVITVFLAGFFTPLLTLATNTLFIPLAVAVSSIMVRIPAIAASWYTWGRISPRAHALIMWVMALSGFGIPFGFRAVFAEMHYPLAIGHYLQGGGHPGLLAYGNPLFWLLYLHTVAAVISVGGFASAWVAELGRDARGLSFALKLGAYPLFAQLALGPAYWLGLSQYSPLFFEVVTFNPLLAAKAAAVAALAALSLRALRRLNRGSAPSVKPLAALAVLTALAGETLNSGVKYPNLVYAGYEALPARAFANLYLEIPAPLVGVILAFLAASMAVFILASYLALVKRYVADEPED